LRSVSALTIQRRTVNHRHFSSATTTHASARRRSRSSDPGSAQLSPLTYPIKPSADVFYPGGEEVRRLLTGDYGGSGQPPRLRIGSLIARGDVDVSLSARQVGAVEAENPPHTDIGASFAQNGRSPQRITSKPRAPALLS
jgi:hypothetical protein